MVKYMTNSMENFHLLPSAIAKLLDRQEKLWGYFQVEKMEEDLYQLNIPYFPVLKIHSSLDGYTYKAWWVNQIDQAAVYVRKRQEKIRISSDTELERKRKVYEVVYKSDGRAGFYTINHILATFISDRIKDKIKQDMKSVDGDEVAAIVKIKSIS